MDTSIAFIGGGNMATSLIAGLLKASLSAEQILVAEPDADKRQQLENQFAIRTTADNTACLHSQTIVLAVKPQILQQICRQLATSMTSTGPLFLSIAAGIRSDDINRWLGGNQAIVRCMPNTPALLGCGASALYANNSVSQAQRILAENILQAVGISLWLGDEDKIDAVTALSGSGPAYFFLLMEAMQAAGVSLGLDANSAKKLTIQTALGAAAMADSSNEDTSALRARVTSKGGTTEQAIQSFEAANFRNTVKIAMKAAYERSKSMADELGKDK